MREFPKILSSLREERLTRGILEIYSTFSTEITNLLAIIAAQKFKETSGEICEIYDVAWTKKKL